MKVYGHIELEGELRNVKIDLAEEPEEPQQEEEDNEAEQPTGE